VAGVGKRLACLEELSREVAVAELRQAWANLTDEEVALVMAPYADCVREPTPKEREVEEKAWAAMPEQLIATAIGLIERMEPEEVRRRISDLVRTLGIFERGDGIRRHIQTTSEERR
jgi:hypothetical protein